MRWELSIGGKWERGLQRRHGIGKESEPFLCGVCVGSCLKQVLEVDSGLPGMQVDLAINIGLRALGLHGRLALLLWASI